MARNKKNQAKAIAALLTESTAQKAAERAGIGYRTLCRWLTEDEDFQEALAEAEAQCISEAARLIAGGTVEAVAHFRAVLNNKKSAKNRQDRAADKLLRYADKLRLLGSIEQAIEELRNQNDDT